MRGTEFHKELDAFGVNNRTLCPALPARLYFDHRKPFVPMTREELDEQLGSMISVNHTTGGNTILQCPLNFWRPEDDGDDEPLLVDPHKDSQSHCRGVVKIFQSRSIYHHAKRCLELLQDSGITARLLYSDDESLTLVEEQISPYPLWDAPVPFDVGTQLLNIRCILLQHSILHRDFTANNFIVDPIGGKLFVIDFSDAFVGDDRWWTSWRNLVNLFNVWWKWHDEDAQRHELTHETKMLLKKGNVWEPPRQHKRWEPSEEDLKIMGDRPRFDILKDIHK